MIEHGLDRLRMRLRACCKGFASQAAWVLLLQLGCATYRPLPLTDKAVEATLAQNPADITALSSDLHHPLLPSVTVDLDRGLTPDSAALVAVVSNPRLRAERDRKREAAAQLLAAGLLPNPVLGVGLDRPTGQEAGIVTGYGLSLSYDLEKLLLRGAAKEAAAARAAEVDLAVAFEEWQTAEAAKDAVYRLVALQEELKLARMSAKATAGIADSLRDAVAAGRQPADRLLRFEAMSRQAADESVRIEKETVQARYRLEALLGLPADAVVAIAPEVTLPCAVKLPSTRRLLDGIEERRLDLVALRRGYESKEAAVRAAVRSQFPRIGIGVSGDRDTDGIRTGGLGVRIELPLFNHHQDRVALARATRRRLFDEYASRLFEARLQLVSLRSALLYEAKRLAVAEAAAERLASTAASYRQALLEGRADAVATAMASRDATLAALQLVRRRAELARARIALEIATGFFELPAERTDP